MTMTMIFFQRFPRGFANEFEVGIATNEIDAQQYEDEGYRRISRDEAVRDLCVRPQNGSQLFRTVTIDGDPHRYESDARLGRAIRKGEI